MPSYGMFLGALFVLASGITLLQVAANPYVSLLGAARGASSRLNLSQAFNSLGTALAPKFGGLLLLSGAVLSGAALAKLDAPQRLTYQLQQARVVQGPYLGIAITLFVLALIVYLFHLPAVGVAEIAAPSSRTRFAPSCVTGIYCWAWQPFSLRGRGSIHRQFHDQLHFAARHRQYAGGQGSGFRFTLLGRCDGRAVHRFGSAATH